MTVFRVPTLAAFVTDVGSVQRIVAYLGEPTQPPRVAAAAHGPTGWDEDFDRRKGDALALSEPRSVGKPGPGSGPAGRTKDATTGRRRPIP